MILLTNTNKHKIDADKFLISKYNNWWLMWSQWEAWTYSEGEEPYSKSLGRTFAGNNSAG